MPNYWNYYQVQEKTPVLDGYNAETKDGGWSEVCVLFGEPKPVRGDQQIQAQMLQIQAQIVIDSYWDERVTEDMRITDNRKTYDITYVDDTKRNMGVMRIFANEAPQEPTE